MFAGKHMKMGRTPARGGDVWRDREHRRTDLAAHLGAMFPKYGLPDDYIFMAQIPATSTGKFLKTKLRGLHGDHLLKNAPGAA